MDDDEFGVDLVGVDFDADDDGRPEADDEEASSPSSELLSPDTLDAGETTCPMSVVSSLSSLPSFAIESTGEMEANSMEGGALLTTDRLATTPESDVSGATSKASPRKSPNSEKSVASIILKIVSSVMFGGDHWNY